MAELFGGISRSDHQVRQHGVCRVHQPLTGGGVEPRFHDITSDSELFEVLNTLPSIKNRYNTILCSYTELFDLPEQTRHAPWTAWIILIQWTKYNGHWICAWRNGSNILNYFDPFGKTPDAYERTVYKTANTVRNQIVRALRKGKQKLIYNEHKYQDVDAETCGKQCIMRLYDIDLNNTDYFRKVKKICNEFGITPDELAREVFANLSTTS